MLNEIFKAIKLVAKSKIKLFSFAKYLNVNSIIFDS